MATRRVSRPTPPLVIVSCTQLLAHTPGVYSAEASELGWRPGSWPRLLILRDVPRHAAPITILLDRAASNPETVMVYTSVDKEVRLSIFND